jgi:hypothetical protein
MRHSLALLCLAFWRCYPKAKGGHGTGRVDFYYLAKTRAIRLGIATGHHHDSQHDNTGADMKK